MVTDFFDNPIEIGDTVAFFPIGYRYFITGIVISIADKSVLIKHDKLKGRQTETRQKFNQIIKKL